MRLKKARLKRGKIEAVSMGEIGMGKCKYGYYVDKDKHIHIDEEKGEAIRYISNEYIDGKSTKKIFKECYERGWFTSRNTKYSAAATIIKILRDEAYCGTTTENGIVRYPQIISRETFDKVTELTTILQFCHMVNLIFSMILLKRKKNLLIRIFLELTLKEVSF